MGERVTIRPGATLTLRAGAEIRFRPAAALLVQGTLLVEGTATAPVSLVPADEGQPPWEGLILAGSGAPSVLKLCRVRGAQVIAISSGEVRIESCEVSGGRLGISVNGAETRLAAIRNRLADLPDGGIRCTAGAAPLLAENVIERCGPWGILATSGATPEVRGNRVSACASGIEIDQAGARISGNEVRGCERGIALTAVAGPEAVRRNRVEGNRTGILSQHFSSVEVSDNVVTGNDDGVVCFRGARSPILHNEIADNGTGLACTQMSNPEVTANRIARNRRGIYLHLSSYAVIRGNDIVDNAVQVELGNMSLDWERRGGFKPSRGLQQRAQGRVERGRELPGGATADGFEPGAGGVAASGNWWGEATTREMAGKGAAGNIAGIVDGHEVPLRSYEGWEGEYVQDKVVYAPWAAAPVPGAGPRPERAVELHAPP